MARSFFITRASANSEDPTALEFFPPKGSDELHEALKEAFPYESNLAARMRAAVIEFLLQEQQAEQLTPISTEYLPSPQSTFISTMPSPAIATSQETSPQQQAIVSGQPSQEALMDVWSLPNKPQAKIHTRRTMTSDEKKAYKQKRLIGACADCKRRRRKCEHNNSAGGSSIVPQKVGKHKKRVTVAEAACKTDATVDFSWSATGFNFDEAMAIEPEMSFDFNATDFNFSPDLSDDWQLFPDLPMANNNYTDSCSPDYSQYDATIYSPRASLSQQRVSTGPEGANILDHSMYSRTVLGSAESFGCTFQVDSPGSSSIANLPISPVTPVSQSPVSRTQSASGDLHGHNKYSSEISHNDFFNFATGANVEQARVSRDKPIQVPLPTPDSLSPVTRSQPLNDTSAGAQTESLSPTTTTFRSDRSSNLQQVSSDLSRHQTTDCGTTQLRERDRLRSVSSHEPALQRDTIDTRQREGLLVIEELLQTRSTLQSSSSTQSSRKSKKQALGTTPRDGADASLTAKSCPSPSRTSRTPVTSSTSVVSLGLLTSSLSTTSRLRSTTATANAPLAASGAIDQASSAEDPRSQSQNRLLTSDRLAQKIQRRRDGDFFDQAPTYVALFAAYHGLSHSSGLLAAIATLLLGAVMIGMHVQSADLSRLSHPTSSNIVRAWTKSTGFLQVPETNSRQDRAVRCRPSSRPTWTASLSSHVGLLRATAIV